MESSQLINLPENKQIIHSDNDKSNNKEIAISVKNVSKKYRLYNSNFTRIKELLLFNLKRLHREFWALKDISFDIQKGSTIGIIGRNGSGKSTLLKLICGITYHNTGEIKVNGRISSLLEVGVGFNPELTGRDNIYLQGTLMGYSKKEMNKRCILIEEFADIGEFIDQPIKHYSSGMAVRLGFSCAINVDPDIVIVDEALAVGDIRFQQKCYAKFSEFQKEGKTILLVSHDMTSIKKLCDRVIFLDQGEFIKEGDPEQVINYYNMFMAKLDSINSDFTYIEDDKNDTKSLSYGNFWITIKHIAIVGKVSGTNTIQSGENACISVVIESFTDENDVDVAILIKDKYGQEIFGTNLFHHNKMITVEKNKKYLVTFTMSMNIGQGKYTISPAVVKGGHPMENHVFQWLDNAIEFEIAHYKGHFSLGICTLFPSIQVENIS